MSITIKIAPRNKNDKPLDNSWLPKKTDTDSSANQITKATAAVMPIEVTTLTISFSEHGYQLIDGEKKFLLSSNQEILLDDYHCTLIVDAEKETTNHSIPLGDLNTHYFTNDIENKTNTGSNLQTSFLNAPHTTENDPLAFLYTHSENLGN